MSEKVDMPKRIFLVKSFIGISYQYRRPINATYGEYALKKIHKIVRKGESRSAIEKCKINNKPS